MKGSYTSTMSLPHAPKTQALIERIRAKAMQLGFSRFGISGIELGEDAEHLRRWLDAGMHGTMQWMAAHVMTH